MANRPLQLLSANRNSLPSNANPPSPLPSSPSQPSLAHSRLANSRLANAALPTPTLPTPPCQHRLANPALPTPSCQNNKSGRRRWPLYPSGAMCSRTSRFCGKVRKDGELSCGRHRWPLEFKSRVDSHVLVLAFAVPHRQISTLPTNRQPPTTNRPLYQPSLCQPRS